MSILDRRKIARIGTTACKVLFFSALRIWFLSALLILTSCKEEPDFPERFRSDHFVVFSNYEYDRVLGEQWLDEWLEKHYEIHTEYLGATADRGEPIRIYIFDQHNEFVRYCAEGVAACTPTDRPVAYSTYLLDTHELIHIYSREFGFGTPFFNEGLAYMLSSQAFIPGDLVPKGRDIRTLLVGAFNYEDPDLGALTSSFTRFLINSHGIESFMQFFRRLDGTTHWDRFESIFAQVFLETLEEAILRWRALNNNTRGDATLNLAQCDAPQLRSLTGGEEEITLRWGPRRNDEEWSVIRTFEVVQPSQLRMRATTTNFRMDLGVQGCEEEHLTDGVEMHVDAFGTDAIQTNAFAATPETNAFQVSHELWADLARGRYWVALYGRDYETPPSTALSAELTTTLWNNEEPTLVGGQLQQIAVVREADACNAGVCETSFLFEFEEPAMMAFRPQDVFPFDTMDITAYVPRGPEYIEVCRSNEEQWIDCVRHTDIDSRTLRLTSGDSGDLFRVTLGQAANTAMAMYFTFNLEY
jgi:hypothetical protein